MILKSKPIDDGYFMPHESYPHYGTILCLPYRKDTWRELGKPARLVYEKIIKTIAKYEKVILFIDPSISTEKSKYDNSNISVVIEKYDDAWARDTMPLFLVNKNNDFLRAVDFRFNAWGGLVDGLYPSWENDDLISLKLCERLNMDYYRLESFILEGGSINLDGIGTCLTTKACLLSAGRNNLSIEEIEEYLNKYLGVKKVIWLDNGIYLDETNEHIDNMAVFSAPRRVLLAFPEDTLDLQYEVSLKAYNKLLNETDALGNKLEIIKVPLPRPIKTGKEDTIGIEDNPSYKREENMRLAASYINYYVGNGFVLVPKFNDPADDKAYAIIKNEFKDRDVIQIESKEILLGGGNIHCITQQIPKGGIKCVK